MLVIYSYKKINKNQLELGIKTYDFNVPDNHISRFVVDFVEECYPILGIKEKKKNKKKVVDLLIIHFQC